MIGRSECLEPVRVTGALRVLKPTSCTHISARDKGCVASQVKRPPPVAFHTSCDGFPRGPMPLETSVLEFNTGALRCLFVKLTSTSLVISRSVSRVHSGLISQLKTTRTGGS